MIALVTFERRNGRLHSRGLLVMGCYVRTLEVWPLDTMHGREKEWGTIVWVTIIQDGHLLWLNWSLAAQDRRSCSTAQRPPAQPITPSSQDIIAPVNGAHDITATGNDTTRQNSPK
jgi:hypothetical protein